MTRGEEIPRDVSDAVLAAINAATLADYLSFATPAAVAASTPRAGTLSPSTARRHLAGLVQGSGDARTGVASVAFDGLTLMLPNMSGEGDKPSPQDAVVSFLTHLRHVLPDSPPVGVEVLPVVMLAASSSDSTAADALRGLRVALEHWLCRVLPRSLEQAVIARDLMALRISDCVRWHGLRAHGATPVEQAAQDAVTATTHRLVSLALPDNVSDESAEHLDTDEEMAMMVADRPGRREPADRHSDIVLAVCQLLACARLSDYLAFLTPARIVHYLQHRLNRTTVAYHLRDRQSDSDAFSLPATIETIQVRVNAQLASGGIDALYGPAGFATPEMTAKRRLWLLASASADATVMAGDPLNEHDLEQVAVDEAAEFLRFSGVPNDAVASRRAAWGHALQTLRDGADD